MAHAGWSAGLFTIARVPLPGVAIARVGTVAGVPLFAGLFAGEPIAGVVAAASGLLTTLADIGTTRRARSATMAAAAVAMLVGGTIGARFGGTTHTDEVLIFVAALLAGWVSTDHAGLSTVARFFAMAVAIGAGLHFTDPAVAWATLAGGVLAMVVAFITWQLDRLPANENLFDWRAGIREGLAGLGTGPLFALCYALAAIGALQLASHFGVQRPYWATVAVLMVMRREGLLNLRLVIQYMTGTLAGVLLAAAVTTLITALPVVALAATACAAFARIAVAINPALGYASLTAFFLMGFDLALRGSGQEGHLLSARLLDVGVGCLIAMGWTLVARAAERVRGAYSP